MSGRAVRRRARRGPGRRYVTKRGNTTYVTYTSNGLPLANLIRDVVPFGNLIADLTEPLLKNRRLGLPRRQPHSCGSQ